MTLLKRFCSSSATAACLLVATLLLGADGRRSITETDLYDFHWIANAQISPDGSRVIYTLVKTTPKHDNYETALWIIPSAGGTARQLTSGPHDSGARWSPDGKLVAFLRATEKDGKPQPAQIYLLAMDGGEARPLTDIPKGAADSVWAPDGHSIAFTTRTQAKDFEAKNGSVEESDVRVVTSARYRTNGAGYREPDRPSHIWVVGVPQSLGAPPKAKQITTGEFDESDITWSGDGSRIYFTSNQVKEPDFEPADSDVYVVSAGGGAVTKVASIDGPIGELSLSPDGRRIAFVGEINREGAVLRSYSQTDLFVTGVEPGSTPMNLTAAYDRDVEGGVGGDQAPPRGGGRSRPYWSADGRNIFLASADEGRTNLMRVETKPARRRR